VVYDADLVLFVGSHTGDQVTNGWTIPRAGTRVIQVDIDPSELGRSYPNEVSLQGDAKITVRRLGEMVSPRGKKTEWAARAREVVASWKREVEPHEKSDVVPIRPERLCRELAALLPENAVLVADTGFASIWTGTLVDITSPGQTYLRAAGSLGWGFPASLGAKCAVPDRPVICFTGDGGFWYHSNEMETAARCGIKTVTLVNNNSTLAQDIRSILLAYGDRPGKREELYRFRDVHFARMAEEMGCRGIRVEHPEGIAPALREALAGDKPAVVEVITDPECRAPDPWTPPPG
jgi:acetolactate synthase-1/2/3 large subunit